MTRLHPAVEVLKQERATRGLSLNTISTRSGIGRTTIGAWLSGDHDPYLTAFSDCLASLGLQLAVIPATKPAKPLTRPTVEQRDKLLEEMLPQAGQFAVYVRDQDHAAVGALLDPILYPLDLQRLLALLVAVAAMVPADAPQSELTAWTHQLEVVGDGGGPQTSEAAA